MEKIDDKSDILIGRRIKALRSAAGLTQGELSEAISVKQSLLSFWETGKRVPRWRHVVKLGAELKCSPEELIQMSEKDFRAVYEQYISNGRKTPEGQISRRLHLVRHPKKTDGLFSKSLHYLVDYCVRSGVTPDPDVLATTFELILSTEEAKRDAFHHAEIDYQFSPDPSIIDTVLK